MAIQKVLLKNDTYPDGMYPQTRTDCVFDEDGNSLETLLGGPELLWTNASPSSTMSSGVSLTFDYSGYRFLLIIYKVISNGTTYESRIVPIISGSSGILYSFAEGKLRLRGYNITQTGLTVGAGNSYNTYGTNTTDSYMCVPYQIYGIK